jgi:DNA-binding Xre family transcriptional regulator
MAERHVVMRLQLRQVMATRGLFATSDLVPLLADRGVHLSRQYVHKLVTTTPQRVNIDLLAALCDALECQTSDLLQPVVEELSEVRTGTSNEPDRKPGEGLDIGRLRPIRARVRRPYPHNPGGGSRGDS